jgi:steroid delta-isomerase-like uncharacterized protein
MNDQLVQNYFAAWNAHDAKPLISLLANDATYSDPSIRLPAKPYDLEVIIEDLVSFIPDFSFEVVAVSSSDKKGMAEWILKGTNSKPIKPGIDATEKTLHLRGVDIFDITQDHIQNVTRYYDQKSMFEQIGMQFIIEPIAQGKATYGYSKRVASGNPAIPAVFGTTWIQFKDQSELDHIRTHSAKIIQDFLDEPGFISIVTGAAGNRAFTTTAWENEKALYDALDKAHARAKQDFRTSDLSPAVWTAVWKPDHINRLWVRCSSCLQPNDMTHAPTNCANCGEKIPERPAYW